MKTLILLLFVLRSAAPPEAQPIESQEAPQPPPLFAIGEVTGTDVNVRSGPSGNYYVVTRLSAGHRVVIVDRRPSWVAIAPPKGAYSLIAREYIDPDPRRRARWRGRRPVRQVRRERGPRCLRARCVLRAPASGTRGLQRSRPVSSHS